MDDMRHEIRQEIASSIDGVKRELQNVLDDNTSVKRVASEDPSFAQVLAKEVDTKLGLVSNEMRSMQKTLTETRAAVTEEQDKENRRNNVILYRVPESTAIGQLWKEAQMTSVFVTSLWLHYKQVY